MDWNTIDQQVTTMIQNNQPPDVLNLNAFASYAKDGSSTPPTRSSPRRRARTSWRPSREGANQGKQYGFPILASARAFFYKRTCSRRPASPSPEDLGRFLQAAQKIQALGGWNDRVRAAARPRGGPGRVVHLDVEQRRRLEVRRRWTIDSDKNVQTLQFLADLANGTR